MEGDIQIKTLKILWEAIPRICFNIGLVWVYAKYGIFWAAIVALVPAISDVLSDLFPAVNKENAKEFLKEIDESGDYD